MARNAPTYCDESDLLIGDITLGVAYSRAEFIAAAADEMDSRIGVRYVLPLPAVEQLNTVTGLILKRINAQLASGRLIMSVASAGEDDSLHAYGKYLVDQAMDDLLRIERGDIILRMSDDSIVDEVGAASAPDGPIITNRDEQSGVDTFYENFTYGHVWAPGARS